MNCKVLLTSSSLILAACTTPVVRDTTAIDEQTAKCETVECVIKLMDTLPQGPDSDRYPFMEGYPDSNLEEMHKQKRLDVGLMSPLMLLIGMWDYGYIQPKKFGGIDTCKARYLPGGNWTTLKHVLSHCQGYDDHGIPLQVADYTDEQKAIMEREGVSKWTSTSVYRSIQNATQR